MDFSMSLLKLLCAECYPGVWVLRFFYRWHKSSIGMKVLRAPRAWDCSLHLDSSRSWWNNSPGRPPETVQAVLQRPVHEDRFLTILYWFRVRFLCQSMKIDACLNPNTRIQDVSVWIDLNAEFFQRLEPAFQIPNCVFAAYANPGQCKIEFLISLQQNRRSFVRNHRPRLQRIAHIRPTPFLLRKQLSTVFSQLCERMRNCVVMTPIESNSIINYLSI